MCFILASKCLPANRERYDSTRWLPVNGYFWIKSQLGMETKKQCSFSFPPKLRNFILNIKADFYKYDMYINKAVYFPEQKLIADSSSPQVSFDSAFFIAHFWICSLVTQNVMQASANQLGWGSAVTDSVQLYLVGLYWRQPNHLTESWQERCWLWYHILPCSPWWGFFL